MFSCVLLFCIFELVNGETRSQSYFITTATALLWFDKPHRKETQYFYLTLYTPVQASSQPQTRFKIIVIHTD